jgi:C4-dicarboxylate-specific signal transduction histidine kinase
MDTPHPGTPRHDPETAPETASDPEAATGRASAVGDWAASLANLLRAAFREVDTDRERAKASLAKASSLLRVQIELSFDPADDPHPHGRPHGRRPAEAAPDSAQADLAHVARLATMGELTASIAHEINQPLGAIATQATACLRWLERDKPDLARAREGLVLIEREARRAGDVVRGVRSLARRSDAQQSEVDLDNAIEEVLSLVRSEIGRHGVTLRSDLQVGNRRVHGNRVQLQQVLLNLVMNSIEAMSTTADRPRVLSVSSEPTAFGGILVTVEDSGAGLDPAIGDRIFNAFSTTKPNGMGMGLSISRSIIEAHGGRIWASPSAPQGAIFQFFLPALHGD